MQCVEAKNDTLLNHVKKSLHNILEGYLLLGGSFSYRKLQRLKIVNYHVSLRSRLLESATGKY